MKLPKVKNVINSKNALYPDYDQFKEDKKSINVRNMKYLNIRLIPPFVVGKYAQVQRGN